MRQLAASRTANRKAGHVMTDTQKVEKVKALIEEVGVLSQELSEDELEQVAGGGVCRCYPNGNGAGDPGIADCACTGSGGGRGPRGPRCLCSDNGFGGATELVF
jgi:hypothetical protein